MKFQLIIASVLAATMFSPIHAATDPHRANWLLQFGGLGPEIVFDLVETPDKRLCATGTFTNTAHFGTGNREVTLVAADIQDIYLSCFDRTGALQRAIQFNANISDQPRAIAAMGNGDVIVTGFFEKSLTVAGTRLETSGNVDLFLLRISPAGEAVWAKRFGGQFGDSGNALAITEDGDIVLGGSFQGVMTYPQDGATRKLVSAGGRDAFVLRLDGQGHVKWGRSFGGALRDEASKVVANADGGVVLAGTFEAEAAMDDNQSRLKAEGGSDAFIVSLDSEGKRRWARQLSGPHREFVSGLVSDRDGNAYLSGNFSGELGVDSGISLSSAGGTDMFVAAFDHAGNTRWARPLGGDAVDESFDLALSDRGTLLLSGHFQGSMALGSGQSAVRLSSSGTGNADGLLIELDRQGQYLKSTTAAGDGVETAFVVTALSDGGMALGGFFNKEVIVPGSGFEKIKKRGKTDVFLMRMPEPHPTL